MALRQLEVLMGSSAGRRPSIVVIPSDIAPNKSALCEIDLSPGTRTFPYNRPPEWSSRAVFVLPKEFKEVIWNLLN